MFKTAMEKMVSDDYKIIIRADKRPIGEHERRFNAPQVNEVAVVMVDNESSFRDIVVQRRSNKLERIAETHYMYDALQYPLIFWQVKMATTSIFNKLIHKQRNQQKKKFHQKNFMHIGSWRKRINIIIYLIVGNCFYNLLLICKQK